MSDFHYDPFHTGGEDELSKFENFMHHHQQQQQRHHPQRQQTPNQQYHRHDGFSPRSEDGMSYVSRMKHKNYAKVVQEMKMKQSGDDDVDERNHYHAGGQRQQQQYQQQHYHHHQQQQQQQQQQQHYQQQQMQQGRGGRGDARRQSMQPQQCRSDQGFETSFNNANQFSAQQHEYQFQQYATTASHLQQQQQQQQSYYNGHSGKMPSSSPQPLAPSRADRSPASAYNHCNNSANNPSLVSNDNNHASIPTRTGRKLFQDPSDSHASRSRSTVRRTADRTLQLAMLASNTDSHDTMSDVGSVFSSYSVSGESFAGYPSHQQHRQNQFNRQSSNNSNLSSKSLSNSLDAFVAKSKTNFGSSSSNNNNNNSYYNDDENCSVVSGVSGAGSVAARRRAAKNRQYPPQHSTYNGKSNDFNPTSTATTPSSNKQWAIASPPHQSPAYMVSPGAASVASSTTSSAAAGAAVSARSRMRMRMQQAATSSNVTPVRTIAIGDPSSPGIVVPIDKQALMNQTLQSQQQQQQQQTPPQPKRPVLFGASAANDMHLSSDTIEHEVNLALSELKISHPEIIDVDFISTISRLESGGSVGDASLSNSIGGGVIECAGGSGSGSGSIKGVGLKKTCGSGVGTGRISPHTISTKSMTIINSTVVDPPTASSTAVPATATGQNAVISPVISVEQYSESSSLTDDVGSDSCNNNRTSGVSNIFKDAERMGSTFHKSKKIVRPGESVIPEERQMISSGVVPTQSSTATPPPSSTSSVRDRISGLNKDSSSPGVRAAARTQSNRFPRIHEEAAPSTSNASPSVGSKTKHNFPPKSSTPTTPPRPSSSSSLIVQTSSTVGNPFAVQLRKTNLPPLGSTPSITRSSPPAFKKGTTDSTNVATAKATDATEVVSSFPVVPQSLQENVVSREAPNPFLAGIKLRPTFGGGASGIVGLKPQPTENNDITTVDTAADSCQGVANENTKQKLSYREQQELIRQQQRPEENEMESTHSTAEAPKKDVATLIRERIAASKTNTVSNNDFSRGAASNKNSLNSIGTITKPAAAISPGHDPKDCTDTVVSSSSEKESEPDPRAALMAMLNKRAATSTALPAATSTPMQSEVVKGENAKSVAKNALSTMFADRAKKESGGAQNNRDGPKNALLSSMLANRAPPQASSEYHGSRASHSEDHDGDSGRGERPALKNDPKYEKYFKMLKMGMPLPAVQHAMTRDGLDPSVMDGDHNLPEPQHVPLKDDPDYSKYFKMLKLGLPMGAVKNAMERDGIDPSVMDGDHNAPVSSSTSRVTSSSNNMKQKDTHRRTRLHWDALEDTKVNSNSVWALVGEDAELNQIEIDEQEFTTLFQAEIKSEIPSGGGSGGGTVGGGGGGSNRNMVQVIDPKRANNGGIILARLRMSYDDMARAVETIDETVMTANQAQGIIEYMPTFAERKALRDYMKNSNDGESAAKCFERLCECEKFMVAMMTVKQSKRKIRALLFKLQFRGCIHDLARDVFLIEKACDELSNSVRLRKLFGIVLNIGNRLNTAGPGQKRKAGAFSIKSLLKLNQAKAFDNKTTFLHYVVLVVQRNNDALLDFKDDLPTVSKADKIYWDQCISELEEIETQLENVRKVSLHEAKSSKVMYQLPKKKKSADADNDSDDLSVESMSLEDEVQLLRSTKTGMFALSAIRKVSQLRERVDTAKDKFASLLEYLGESGNSKMQPHELFEIINTFCRTFDVARADVEKMEKVKKRDDKKGNDSDLGAKNEKLKAIQEVQSPESNKSPPTKASTTPLPRASSHQPNMGNVLADLKRASLATFSTPATKSTSLNYGDGPPRVQHRHPDDESSPGASEGGPGATSPKSRHSRMQETKPTSPSPQSLIRPVKVTLTGEANECVRKEQHAYSMEVAHLATEVIEKRLAEEAAVTEDDARQALLEKHLEEEADTADEMSRDVNQRQKSGTVHQTLKSVVDVNNATPCDELVRAASQQISQATDEASVQHPETSDVKDSTGSENRTPDPIKTRRDMMLARRERARSRQPRVSSSPTRTTSSSITTAAIPPAPPATTAPSNFVQADAQRPNNSSSHANTAALARERYARHKKMLQQRRG